MRARYLAVGAALLMPASLALLLTATAPAARARAVAMWGGIAALAVAVRDGQADRALDLLRSGAPGVSFVEDDGLDAVRDDVVRSGREVTAAARTGDAAQALRLPESRSCPHTASSAAWSRAGAAR